MLLTISCKEIIHIMMKMASSRMTVSASLRLAKESFRDLMIMKVVVDFTVTRCPPTGATTGDFGVICKLGFVVVVVFLDK